MPHTPIPANVLIVDDQPANLLALEAALEPLAVNLVRAMSGLQALAALETGDFAAVLLDVRMPGMDGFEVAREIRSRPRTRFTPILFVTAGDDPDEAMMAAYALGAVDFLAKPLRTAVLQAKVGVFVELYRSKEELRARERRDFEQRLEAKEERYRTLFESIDEGFCVIQLLRDNDGQLRDYRFEEANEAFVMHTGLADPVGRSIREVVQGEDRRWLDIYDRVASTGEATRFVEESKAMNRWFDVYAARLGGPGSDRLAVIFSDITQRLLAEQDLRRLADELAQANKRKTEFLATLAHELRNPLAPLSNGLHLMRMAGGKAELVEKTRQMMERQVQHMVHLVDDLLDVARISTGKVELRRRAMDLLEVVATAVETSGSLIDAAGHKLQLELAPGPLAMDADPTRIAQVVSNLLNNAAKYTPPAGTIRLQVRREGDEAVLSVSDTGIGIAPDSIAKVFEMFAQVSNGERPQGGLGIGLSLVQSLVVLHGGSIAATSPGPGLGSTFTVRLPLAPLALDGQPAAAGTAVPAPGQLDVLVVDDNTDAAESLGVLLEMEGHASRIAHNGKQALAMAQARPPDVVFLDIGLPDVSGYDVARSLRAMPPLTQTLLVALTGWGTEDDRQRTREAGFDLHLTKPAELSAVEELLRVAAQAKSARSS
ncbi:MAG: putative histidine kinase, atypical hybrid [Ramlibacter sp.]|uniref:response regulator n=1 Tax=Ramlibacter sp. TaxID=1917967 RepID=UPI002620BBBB|nr:response regulator [Ramlibacter sp.]MDB5752788.1 putative histidine kinase, atypical hybrid [Ramlibacter sp.]